MVLLPKKIWIHLSIMADKDKHTEEQQELQEGEVPGQDKDGENLPQEEEQRDRAGVPETMPDESPPRPLRPQTSTSSGSDGPSPKKKPLTDKDDEDKENSKPQKESSAASAAADTASSPSGGQQETQDEFHIKYIAYHNRK